MVVGGSIFEIVVVNNGNDGFGGWTFYSNYIQGEFYQNESKIWLAY